MLQDSIWPEISGYCYLSAKSDIQSIVDDKVLIWQPGQHSS